MKAVAWIQNAYLFEQVGPQPNKENKNLQTKQTKSPEISIKIFILLLGLTLKSGFLKGNHEVLIGPHNIVTHFCRKSISGTSFRVYRLRQHQQLISFISSLMEYTACALCLIELTLYFYLQQSLEINTFSSLEISFIFYEATALTHFCSSHVLDLLLSLRLYFYNSVSYQ